MSPERTFTIAALAVALAAGMTCTRHSSLITHHSSLTSHHSLLRVCADPNNLPFSNAKGDGFENKIAELIARDFHSDVRYTFLPQRLGFVRNTLKHGDCDVIIGVPTNYEQASTTQPYYRSSYVFVSRNHAIESLDDPRLRSMRIGVLIPSPAVQALSTRSLSIHAYPVLDDGAHELVTAVARGEVDVAIVWGPQGGYFARNQHLDITPVSPQIDPPFLPFVYDISMGVRRGDTRLRARLDDEIERRRADIDRILDSYGVPRV
jgi:mxaJ protein